ncbi:MAG: NfeD family protein [Bacteroidales bacterium]|jgi:membrane-bound ClpP family serine protease
MALIITLVVIGILLLAIELLITPGFGLPGILGLLSIIGGVVLSFIEYGNLTGIIVLACVIATLSAFTWMVLRSKTWKSISLSESISSKSDTTPLEKGLATGRTGVALSRLAPSGKARFDGIDAEVWSQSGIINSGTLIQITNTDGNKITVKPVLD